MGSFEKTYKVLFVKSSFLGTVLITNWIGPQNFVELPVFSWKYVQRL
jgi:hypothetical protein